MASDSLTFFELFGGISSFELSWFGFYYSFLTNRYNYGVGS